MAEAADQAHAVQLSRPFLETADQQHVVIEFFEGFRVAFGGFGHGFGCRFFRFSEAGKWLLQAPRDLARTLLFYCAAVTEQCSEPRQSSCGKVTVARRIVSGRRAAEQLD